MSPIPTVDTETLAAWIDRDEAVLIDVREDPFFRAGHIPGARSVPYSRFDSAALPSGEGRRLVFNCELGILSERAAERARELGGGEVFHLAGGIRAWQAAGRPIEGTGKGPISLQRQVQVTAGSLVLAGSVLAAAVSPWWLLLPGLVGAGLVFAGATGTCGMTAVLARLPFNRASASTAEG